MTIIKYNTEKYNFFRQFEYLFLTDMLYRLDEDWGGLFKVGADSITKFHTRFYDMYRQGWPAMEDIYERFIAEIISPMIDEDFLYQKFPTVRFHLKNNVAVGDFHTDSEFGHPVGELNFIIPLTDSDGTASIWVESEIGNNDFHPIPMRLGELIQFNGNQLRHGNKKNETGLTRVSMDFRVLPISKYNESCNSESITTKTKFKDGEYYKRFIKWQGSQI